MSDKKLILISGANQGGKTTWLRSFGQAQLMAQCGMFIAADYFRTRFYDGIFTHFSDHEAISEGLLNQELRKMEGIIDEMKPGSLVLMNESFQTTTEYDGYAIGKEIVDGLVKAGVTIAFVTHNFLLADCFYRRRCSWILFLQPEIGREEKRLFTIKEGRPQPDAHAWNLHTAHIQQEDEK